MDDVLELTIPQLEYILEGCKKNNEEIQKETKGTNNQTLSGADAIQFLANSGEVENR